MRGATRGSMRPSPGAELALSGAEGRHPLPAERGEGLPAGGVSATLVNMFAPPPVGFYVLALDIYAFIAAAVALNEHFIAPLALIFFTLDHTEFMILIVAAICGVDLYLKPTAARAVIFAIALLPLVAVIVAIAIHVMSSQSRLALLAR
jgi:hypothetical protein